jgi:AAA15 family ATPase/GTPase
MIINFSIRNFYSIKDEVTLSFEATSSKDLEEYYVVDYPKELRLLKLGVIYGANASGKTTILKALSFLRNMVLNPFVSKVDKFNYTPFLFVEVISDKNSFFSIEFIQNQTKYLYQIEFNTDAIVSESLYFFKPNKALIFKRNTNIQKQLSEIEFGSKIKVSKESKVALTGNTLWNNTVLAGYLKTNFESKELQEVVSWFKDKLQPVIFPNSNLVADVSSMIEKGELSKAHVIDILRKADFGISDIVIEKTGVSKEFIYNNSIQSFSERTIKFQHLIDGIDYSLNYNDESAGTKRYYQFSGLLILLIKNRWIVSIDELETSLHPDLIKHFLLTFMVNSKESQLITTTHHRELLLEKDILRNDVIWFTDKKEDGSTDLFSLSEFNSSVIRNTSSVYNAYKIGKLGAVPDLIDYYVDLKNGKE